MRRHFSISAASVGLLASLLFISCAQVESRRDSAQTQMQTISDIIAANVGGSIAFKDTSSLQGTLSTISRSDTDCAIALNTEGSLLGQYDRPNTALNSERLAAVLQKQFPEIRSAYTPELGAFVAVSTVKAGTNTIGYIALARK